LGSASSVDMIAGNGNCSDEGTQEYVTPTPGHRRRATSARRSGANHPPRATPFTKRMVATSLKGEQVSVPRYFKMFTALATTRPRTARLAVACTAIASLAQRASGMTSVGLKATALVKARYR
jgi:hypothetical protein